MKPADFVTMSTYRRHSRLHRTISCSRRPLGPNAWQAENAEPAMAKALELIKEYVKAGYQKIHLDASMFCADDVGDRHQPRP